MTKSAEQFCHQNYTTPTTTNNISSNRNLIHLDQHDHEKTKKLNIHLIRFMKPSQVLFNLFLVFTILSHSKAPKSTTTQSESLLCKSLLSQNHISHPHQIYYHKHYHSQTESHRGFFLFAESTLILECENDTDCDGNGEKICHENKCMCNKDRPIEAGGFCLPMQFIDEPCQVEGQCLGGSQCIDGTCSCGSDGIRIENPSQKIYYCHPRRQLNEQCINEIQCPSNAYCSDVCLCQNGFAPANIKTSLDGPEIFSCLPITCSDVSQCESSEFYQCEENKCKCMPTHFDPTRAKCYRLGSLQLGNLTDENSSSNNKTLDDITMENSSNNRILLILNDLIESTTGRADLFWLLIVVIFLILILLIAVCCCHVSCCKSDNHDHANRNRSTSWLPYLLPCCYIGRKHHQEWDPTDAKAAPPDGAAFLHEDNRKNNVNQKSFRRKKNLDSNAESADEYDDVLDPKSSLVKNNSNTNNNTNSQTSKNNDYQVIYFGDQKRLPQTKAAEEANQNDKNKSINEEDKQFRINIIANGKVNGITKPNNSKNHLFQNGTQNNLTNHNSDTGHNNTNCNPNSNQHLDHIIVPTNSTLV